MQTNEITDHSNRQAESVSMGKDDARDQARRDPDPDIAAADWLFQDDPGAKPAPKPVTSDAGGSGEIFALADGQSSSVEVEPAAPTPPVNDFHAQTSARPRREGKSQRTADKPMLEPSALVEEVWSRTAEWGPNLVVVAGWLLLVLTVVYFSLQVDLYGIAFLTLLMGGLAAIVLSYPIFITLERPVRITPEQAVRDFYGALSHHMPHFKRMWLLLSTAGRTSTAFGSLDGFKAYWKDRLASLCRACRGDDPTGFRGRRFQGREERRHGQDRRRVHPEDLGARPAEERAHSRCPHENRPRAQAPIRCGISRTGRWDEKPRVKRRERR